jgi:hypothetical protein
MLHRLNLTSQELFGPAGTARGVVIGAGMGGIALGVELRPAGIATATAAKGTVTVAPDPQRSNACR